MTLACSTNGIGGRLFVDDENCLNVCMRTDWNETRRRKKKRERRSNLALVHDSVQLTSKNTNISTLVENNDREKERTEEI